MPEKTNTETLEDVADRDARLVEQQWATPCDECGYQDCAGDCGMNAADDFPDYYDE
jgi:hypothetical protein